jgi:hypothetical protein
MCRPDFSAFDDDDWAHPDCVFAEFGVDIQALGTRL